MRRSILVIWGILSLVLFSEGYAMMRLHHSTPQQAMRIKVDMYKNYSFRQLMPALHRVGLPYPPKKIALIAIKSTKTLELWGKQNGPWKHVKNYKIFAASGHAGPKLHEGDRQVPEGIYHINAFNPNSHFDLSMRLNYPNAFDQRFAKTDGRNKLGNNIFIHGQDQSIGCIAIGNKNIEQLFVLAYFVGEKNIEVIVAPNDLRRQQPIYTSLSPIWVPTLYSQIKQALQPFKG